MKRNLNNIINCTVGIVMEKYTKNSPLVEAVCDIQFGDDSKWDGQIPDKLYELIKDKFPNRTSRIKTSCPGLPKNKEEDQLKINKTEYVVFSNENKKIEILICNKKCLIVSILKPSPSWDAFESTIKYALLKISEVTPIKKIKNSRLYY